VEAIAKAFSAVSCLAPMVLVMLAWQLHLDRKRRAARQGIANGTPESLSQPGRGSAGTPDDSGKDSFFFALLGLALSFSGGSMMISSRYSWGRGVFSWEGVLLLIAWVAVALGFLVWGLRENWIHYNRRTGERLPRLRLSSLSADLLTLAVAMPIVNMVTLIYLMARKGTLLRGVDESAAVPLVILMSVFFLMFVGGSFFAYRSASD
jgi:hypothetical protein